MLILPVLGSAQNTDTLILENTKRITVLDQISNPAERKALQEIYRARSPHDKAEKAEKFLRNFPQSWLLAEVYEIAAKAYIDLGEFDRALQDARASLQILPESPLLLVPIANVQAKLGQMVEAERSAHDALEYLQRFGSPSSIPEKKWPETQKELEASCYFVLGRVRTLQAMSMQPGEQRSKSLMESMKYLAKAKSLNPDDAEIEYLIGLDYIAAGKQNEAAEWIAAAYRRDGPLKTIALAKLQNMYDQSQPGRKQTFNDFLQGLGQPTLPPVTESANTGRKVEMPDYVGSKTCGKCHTDIYQNWSHTGMARMLRPYAPENIMGDFVKDNVFYAGDDVVRDGTGYEFIPGKDRQPFARMIVDHGRHYFEIKQSDRLWHRYPVDYTIGSKWQQAYVTRLPNGQLQVLPIEYNKRYNKWVNFWKIIDVPGTERDNPLTWEAFRLSTNYLANCAACHTSQLKNVKGRGFEADNLVFREGGIDCEMCHGPGGKHVSSFMEGKVYEKGPIDPPVDFTKISSRQVMAVCSQCHMQSAIRVPGADGELNYSRDSDVFFRRYQSRPYDEFSLKARYKDGRFRQTTFIVESLLRSACFKKGGATCISCHDPHPDNASSNPRSLRFRDQPNEMCIQCHGQFKNTTALEQHTRHPANSEASQCASCHMPRIMEGVMSLARTHRIDDIPNLQMTERFGEKDSPNACLVCHTDKNVAWLAEQLGTGWNIRRVSGAQATLSSH